MAPVAFPLEKKMSTATSKRIMVYSFSRCKTVLHFYCPIIKLIDTVSDVFNLSSFPVSSDLQVLLYVEIYYRFVWGKTINWKNKQKFKNICSQSMCENFNMTS